MIELLILIVIVGVVLYFVNQHLPMAAPWKTALNVLAAIFLLIYVLQFFGITHWHLPTHGRH